MHGGIIVVRNPAIVDVVFDGEITAVLVAIGIVPVKSDPSVSVGSAHFVMESDSVTNLVDDPMS